MTFLRRDYKKTFFSVFILLVFVFSFVRVAQAQNGSLYFSPSSGTVSAGQSFSVVVRVNTGGTAINAAEGSITFDSAKLSVSSISKSSSIFTIWASEPGFSNAEGSIEFAGGVPNPGYSGSNGLVLTINFKAKTAGTTEFSLVSGGILANDGLGTNILAGLGKASYNILPGVIKPTPPPGESTPPLVEPKSEQTKKTANDIEITSTTHPDQNKWYSNKNPNFKWEISSGVKEVLLVLSKRANSPPIISYVPPIKEKFLDDLEDGNWYLNGRFVTADGPGPVNSFVFNIDTQAPSSFTITRLDTDDLTNPRPRLLFESSDATSGIDRYEMKIGDGDWFKVEANEAGKTHALPLQKYGERLVEIKAFDKAGNFSSAQIEVKTEPIKVPIIIKEVTKEVKSKQPLVVKGVAEPGLTIIVEAIRINSKFAGLISDVHAKEVIKIDDNRFTTTTTTTMTGEWSVEMEGLPPARYKILAIAQDDRLAVSEPVIGPDIAIRGGSLDAIFRLFNKLIELLSNGALFIAFLVVLVGLILALVELFRLKAKKWIKPFVDLIIIKKSQKKSHHQMEQIIKDMEKELSFLRSLGKRRRLGPEEGYLKSKIGQYIKTLKKLKD